MSQRGKTRELRLPAEGAGDDLILGVVVESDEGIVEFGEP